MYDISQQPPHTFSCVSRGVFAKKGGCPTTISYKMTPTLHQSQSWVYPAMEKADVTLGNDSRIIAQNVETAKI